MLEINAEFCKDFPQKSKLEKSASESTKLKFKLLEISPE
jgi:hypothetical protein